MFSIFIKLILSEEIRRERKTRRRKIIKDTRINFTRSLVYDDTHARMQLPLFNMEMLRIIKYHEPAANDNGARIVSRFTEGQVVVAEH